MLVSSEGVVRRSLRGQTFVQVTIKFIKPTLLQANLKLNCLPTMGLAQLLPSFGDVVSFLNNVRRARNGRRSSLPSGKRCQQSRSEELHF